MTNFLASWYSISSFHWGLSCANSVAKKLCNRKRATCDTAMSGCWFTRPSPNRDRQKLVRFKIIHTTQHRHFSQVAVKLLLTTRTHEVCDSCRCIISIIRISFCLANYFCRYSLFGLIVINHDNIELWFVTIILIEYFTHV